MDTSRYRAFVQASDQGSLSKAAKTLNYTPSGVSQLITALERDLGFSVLDAIHTAFSPHPKAHASYPRHARWSKKRSGFFK